jgi:tRNA(fMet)-specific endonuclease VapC
MTRRYLLDSGSAEDWIRGHARTIARAEAAVRAGAAMGTCLPVVGELWFGGENSPDSRDRNAPRLTLALSKLTLWPFNQAAAEQFGRLRASLKRIGRPMQIVDIQLAAIAVSLGNTTVVSKDSDLFAVPGLSVEDWSIEVPSA